MNRKVLLIAGAMLISSFISMAQKERMPYGTNSHYKISGKLNNNLQKVTAAEVLFEDNFDSYEASFDENKWEVKRSTDITGTDLTDATSPEWFLCKPTNFAGNGATYINSGSRSAAIAYTAPNFTWLTTKEAISVSNDEAALGFWLYFYNNPSQSILTNFHVLVQEDGTETWNILRTWDSESTNNLYEKRVILSLSDYNEKSIRIAFVYENQNDGGYQLAVDDIFVGTTTGPNLSITALPLDFSAVPSMLVDTMKLSLSAKIQNLGSKFADSLVLSASIPLLEEYNSHIDVTDTIDEGDSKVYTLPDNPDFDSQGIYWVHFNLSGDTLPEPLHDSTKFEVTSNLFATDFGVAGGFSLGNGTLVGNLYPIKLPVLASAIQVGWSSFTGGSEPIPFGLEIFEMNPVDSSLTSIYSTTLEREVDHANSYNSYLIDDTYLAPGASYYIAVKQLSTTPLGIGYDMESTGYFFSPNQQGELELFANPSIGNLAIRLIISEPSETNYLNLTVTDGENTIPEATIQIEGFEDLLTDTEGEASIELENGTYIYNVAKEGYVTVTDTVKILYASVDRTVVLAPAISVEFIVTSSGTPLAGAEIIVSGQSEITNEQGTANLSLAAGLHTATVLLSGYTPVVQEIEVTTEANTFDIEMEAATTYNAMFIVVDELENPVQNVRVTIPDLGYKLTNDTGEATFTGLVPDNGIAYTLTKTGFETISKTFNIVDSDVEVKDTLSYFKYDVTFEVTNGVVPINNATITLEGYSSVVSNFSGLAAVSNVIPNDSIPFTVEKTGYATYKGSIAVIDTDVRLTVVLSTSTSSDVDNSTSFAVFPNPSTGNFYVEGSGKYSIRIFDSTGRLIISKEMLENRSLVDISNQPTGIYILQIMANAEMRTIKVVKH
ncbi:MAG TPA: T9SS type A sorting domain-containing protein [Tenuifilaceae bacterium]|nr:T9SS type A sorting domain-containing protein [Tenuifilaceae bacterium]